MAQKKCIEDDDSDEEIEWDDADKVTAANTGATKKIGVILSDSESDDDEREVSPKRKRDDATEKEASKKKKVSSQGSPLDDSSSEEEMSISDQKQPTHAGLSGKETMKHAEFNDDFSGEGMLDGATSDQKGETKNISALDDVSSSDDEEEPVTQLRTKAAAVEDKHLLDDEEEGHSSGSEVEKEVGEKGEGAEIAGQPAPESKD
jgi:hypothetical protein